MSTVAFLKFPSRVGFVSHAPHKTHIPQHGLNSPNSPPAHVSAQAGLWSLLFPSFSLLPVPPTPRDTVRMGIPSSPDSTPTHLRIPRDAGRYNPQFASLTSRCSSKQGSQIYRGPVLGRTYTRTVVWFHFCLKNLIKICLLDKYNTLFIRAISSVLIRGVSATARLPHSEDDSLL